MTSAESTWKKMCSHWFFATILLRHGAREPSVNIPSVKFQGRNLIVTLLKVSHVFYGTMVIKTAKMQLSKTFTGT